MKKKYIQCRSRLLIGLLSLNILASCVHTRHRLGLDNAPRHQEDQTNNRGSSSANNTDQEPNRNGTSSQQVRQGANRDNSQTAGRFNWITTSVQLVARPFARIGIEQLLWVGEWVVIGYFLGRPMGYFLASSPSCTAASLSPYSGSAM